LYLVEELGEESLESYWRRKYLHSVESGSLATTVTHIYGDILKALEQIGKCEKRAIIFY
jgi:hypothetical protein